MTLGRAVEEAGDTLAGFGVETMLAVAVLASPLFAALHMREGGRGTQTLLRVALVSSVLGGLCNAVQGSGFVGLALALAALALAETRAAKDWFETTDPAGGHTPHRPY